MQDIPPLGNLTPRGNAQMVSADMASPAPLPATIQPMSTAPILEFAGSLPALTTWTVTLGTDMLPPGVVKEVRGSLSSLLGTLNITGLGLGSVVGLLLNTNRRFVSFDNGSAVVWRQLQ